jgi:4-amino-4-deoxy-L-arabinose transferase-like glycosyltransferase
MTETLTTDRALRSDDQPNSGRMNRWLGFVLLVALLARLALLVALNPQTGIQGSDSIWYLRQGWAIAHAALDQPLRTVGPLYPLGLAVVWRLVPDAPPPAEDGVAATVVLTLIRLAQIALSLVMVWLAYRLTLRLTSDPRAGLVVVAASGLGPAFVMEAFNILTETLFMFWLTLAIWLYVRDQVGTRGWGAALIGFVLALGTLTRPILLLFPALLALHLLILHGWRAGIRRSVIMLGAFALTLLPWNLYLFSTTGSALPSGFSSNLWIGATGSGQWEGREALDRRRQQFKRGDEDYLSEAFGPITGRPFQWLRLRARCLAGAVLQPHGTVNLTGPSTKRLLSDWWRQDRSLSGLAAVGRSPWFWLKALIYAFHYAALMFAALGAMMALRRWRQYYSVFAIIVYLFGAYGLLTVSPRYLFPAEVLIWVLAAVGVRRLWHGRLGHARRMGVTATPQVASDTGDGTCESVS